MHWVVPTLVAYIIITWLAIVIEDFYYAFIKGRSFCYLPKYEEESKESVHSFVVAVIVVTIWQTSCNTVASQCTVWTIKEIRQQQKNAQAVLGDYSSSIETKRLKVTFALVVLFSVIWIPHGVQAVLHAYIPIATISPYYIVTRILIHGTFLVLPVVYFKMDKRFESFVKTRFRSFFRINTVVPEP
eukprot:gene14335-15829_t